MQCKKCLILSSDQSNAHSNHLYKDNLWIGLKKGDGDVFLWPRFGVEPSAVVWINDHPLSGYSCAYITHSIAARSFDYSIRSLPCESSSEGTICEIIP